jgi:transcriptional regulator with XRE-family HTH domain
MQSGTRGFLEEYAKHRSNGLSDPEIAKKMGMNTSQLRARKSISRNEKRAEDAALANKLASGGMSNIAIGRQMGIPESSVRALRNPSVTAKAQVLNTTANHLRGMVDTGKYIDIGKGVENNLGVSQTKLNTAVALLKEQGYTVHLIQVEQRGTGPEMKTTRKILAPPGTTYTDIVKNRDNIALPFESSPDGGHTFEKIRHPSSLDSKRVGVKYGPEGGANADGVMFVRPGVKDLALGGANYAQVRVLVDGTHYLKGMAMYKDGLPPGVDIQFNTNKKDTGTKHDAFKTVETDSSNPFGTQIRKQIYYTDAAGKRHLSPMNIINEQGNWTDWSNTLSSQILSKQPTSLAKRQLDLALKIKQEELDHIANLTNPVIKRKLLMTFGGEADAASVHLKAAALPRQRNHVILPIQSMKEGEIFAPTYNDGERVALFRHPHGGTFEIPELTVNNKNATARKMIGVHSLDAVGIHPAVARQLSGADFDGDTVLVIPNRRQELRITKPLESLKNFSPQDEFPGYEGMHKMTELAKQQHMGNVSNLITDMTIKGASRSELTRAVRHSMVVIDAVKHGLDYKTSEKVNGIKELKLKYQGAGTKGRTKGAATLISRAGSEKRIPQITPRSMKEGGPIDPATGELVFVPTGKSHRTTKMDKLALTKDARTLISDDNTPIEEIYATHSNSLKGLANKARREGLNTGRLHYSDSAAKTYSSEVKSLTAKLNIAKKNAPLERQAQETAGLKIAARIQDNPGLKKDPEALRKMNGQELEAARQQLGAHKTQIDITPSEWHAIQAGAISHSRLAEIVDHASMDQLKGYATPRTHQGMTSSKLVLARARLASGYTQAQVAQSLGVSVGTLSKALKG